MRKIFYCFIFAYSTAYIGLLTSCNDEFNLVPDPDEVVEIPGYNGAGAVYPIEINDLNQIIGHYGALTPRASSAILELGEESIGFLINTDGESFVELNQPGQLAAFPLAINSSGVIAGEYIPEGSYSSVFLPGYACKFENNGTEFVNLHPDGKYQSSASHITDSGLILGAYSEDEFGSIACMFIGDTILNLIDPQEYEYSVIHSVNNQTAIIYAYDGNLYSYHAYNFADSSLRKLSISSKVADFSELHGLNDHGLASGFYIDLSLNGLAIGITYDLSNDQLLTYNDRNSQGKSKYLEYVFFDINNNGLMVGRAGREYDSGLLQGRAMRMEKGFTGFRDVTPKNSGIYSELISINNRGLALGYLGLPRKNNEVLNKIFVIDVN